MPKPCGLSRFSPTPCRYRFDGRPDPCHWIDKQRVARALKTQGLTPAEIQEAVWDKALIVDGCRAHHDELDGRQHSERIVLLEADYPAKLRSWAAEHRFVFVSPERGWVAQEKRALAGGLRRV